MILLPFVLLSFAADLLPEPTVRLPPFSSHLSLHVATLSFSLRAAAESWQLLWQEVWCNPGCFGR